MRPDAPRFHDGRGLLGASIAISLFGVLVIALGAAIDPRRWFFSYLAAYAYVLTTALGALIFLMTCHAMRASWPAIVRRLTESIVGAIPLLAVLFVPLLFGLDRIYPWIDPERIQGEEARAVVRHEAPYLNLPFSGARGVVSSSGSRRGMLRAVDGSGRGRRPAPGRGSPPPRPAYGAQRRMPRRPRSSPPSTAMTLEPDGRRPCSRPDLRRRVRRRHRADHVADVRRRSRGPRPVNGSHYALGRLLLALSSSGRTRLLRLLDLDRESPRRRAVPRAPPPRPPGSRAPCCSS
jgi:hypothetical protein